MITIAKFQAQATANTEALDVYVQEDPVSGQFHVWIDGGFTSGGADAFICTDLGVALQFAAEEVRIALVGE